MADALDQTGRGDAAGNSRGEKLRGLAGLVVCAMQSPECGVRNATEGELPHLRWRIADDDENWPRQSASRPSETDSATESARAGRSTTQRNKSCATGWRGNIRSRAATKQAAKSSVTALRRQAADELDDEAGADVRSTPICVAARRKRAHGPNCQQPETGSAHHKFLQHLALENASDVAALKSEAARLEREKVLSADECAALDLEAVAAFWHSAPGRQIRANAVNVRRELAFTAKFSPQELAEIVGTKPEAGLENEFVVVQGVADLVVLLPEEIWLVDFKTDEVRAGELPAKIKIYAPQLKLYARALAKIYSRPVTACWLHFLSQKRSVLID